MNQNLNIETANAGLNERHSNVRGFSNAGGNIQAGNVEITPEMQQQGAQLSSQILSGLINRETVDGCGKKPIDLGPLNKKKMDDWKACVKAKADAQAAAQVAAEKAKADELAYQQQLLASQNKNNGFAPSFFTTPTGIIVIVLGAGALVLGGIYAFKKMNTPVIAKV